MGYPALSEPRRTSSLSGSAIYASDQASRVAIAQRGASRVTIEAMNWHPAPSTPPSQDDYYRKRIRQDFWAWKSDVGLA